MKYLFYLLVIYLILWIWTSRPQIKMSKTNKSYNNKLIEFGWKLDYGVFDLVTEKIGINHLPYAWYKISKV